MLLRHFVTLFTTFWVTGSHFTTANGVGSRQCRIQPLPSDSSSQYVAAYLMHYRPGLGCYSNSSSPSHQVVHVINLKLDEEPSPAKRKHVLLKVEPKDFMKTAAAADTGKNSVEVYERPLVFVLNSEQPVKWKVEVSNKFPSHKKLLFLIPKHSTIRFKKRRNGAVTKGRRRDLPSSLGEHYLLSWVKRRYKAVTSYSELNGRKLLFYVGSADVSTSECRLNEMQPSPYAFMAHMEPQPVSGCTSTSMKRVVDRPVYIIELLDVPTHVLESSRQVELDIMSSSDREIEHDFYLVLRSPHDIKWVLRSHRVQGWIDVVSDADVDLRGIRMHTVALRHEELDKTGSDLIGWAEYYVAPVRSYTAVSSANILQLRLPSAESQKGTDTVPGDAVAQPSKHSKPVPRKESPSNDMREHFRSVISTRCENDIMEATIPTLLTQELDLDVDQLSFLDTNCRATRNSTHVILRTPLNQCQTHKMMVDDNDVYSNAIVFHASGMVGAILDEDLGSGYFDLQAASGSGWSDTNVDEKDVTYVDDEDFSSHKVFIDIECQVPRSSEPPVHPSQEVEKPADEGQAECEMHLFSDPFFLQRVVNFPYTSNTFDGVYVFASDPHDSNNHVLMENCWVTRSADPHTSDQEQILLVHQGCTRSPGATWFQFNQLSKMVKDGKTTPERLVISRVLPQNSYLHCQLSTCREGESTGQQCPPNPLELCDPKDVRSMFGRMSRHRSCGLRTIGPIEITGGIGIIDQAHVTSSDTDQPGSQQGDTNGSGSKGSSGGQSSAQQSVIIEGLETGTVVGIAFAAFVIGIFLTGALWFIHTRTGPNKRGMSSVSMVGTSGDVTPNSSSPISA